MKWVWSDGYVGLLGEKGRKVQSSDDCWNWLPVSLVVMKGRLRWFGHVEHKDDACWVECCMMTDFEGDWWRWTGTERRSDGIMSKKRLACPVRMLRIRMSGGWESQGQPANPGLDNVCICMLLILLLQYGFLQLLPLLGWFELFTNCNFFIVDCTSV